LSVVVSVKELNLSPLYTAVDHAGGNDNAAFGAGREAITRDHCPYPLPLGYRLSSVIHQVTATHTLASNSHRQDSPVCVVSDGVN